MSELPTKNGIYWYQLDPGSRADIVQIDDGNVYYMGDATPLSLAHHTSGKFLGPVSVSDFEQLTALQEAHREAATALKEAAFALHVQAHHRPEAFSLCGNVICIQACRTWNALTAHDAALREALKDRKS